MDPPGENMDLDVGQGRKRGGWTDTGNGGRRRHAEQGADTSEGGWRVTGVRNGQVDDTPGWERRLGTGVYIWVKTKNGCWWGGSRRRRDDRKIQKRMRQVGREGLYESADPTKTKQYMVRTDITKTKQSKVHKQIHESSQVKDRRSSSIQKAILWRKQWWYKKDRI